MYTYIYMHIYLCLCICVCMCVFSFSLLSVFFLQVRRSSLEIASIATRLAAREEVRPKHEQALVCLSN